MGGHKRLFREASETRRLDLVRSKATSIGAMILTYRRALIVAGCSPVALGERSPPEFDIELVGIARPTAAREGNVRQLTIGAGGGVGCPRAVEAAAAVLPVPAGAV